MWKIYDELIKGIPDDIYIEQYNIGCCWTMVRAGGKTGVALTVKEAARPLEYDGPIIGMPLKMIAGCVKSWNFIEASLGAAAINAYYNTPEKVEAQGGYIGIDQTDKSLSERKKKNAFIAFADEVKGKKVTVIGHFPHIEMQLKPICDLSILERNPGKGDYPDSACEFILPEQDYVFITGMTFINKTLPRLLQIIDKKAKISIVGPSIPLSPYLYKYGVNNLSGFTVTDQEKLDETIRRGNKHDIFKYGRMVSIDCINM